MNSKIDCLDLYGQVRKVPRDQIILRPAAYAIIVKNGKILLLKMKSTGKFQLPGGGIEAGERIEEALRRELRGETGIGVQVGQLAHFEEIFFYYNLSGKAYHGLHFYYRCEPKTDIKIENFEVSDDSSEKPAWVRIDGLRGEDFQVSGEKILEICGKKEIIIGTGNPAKIQMIRSALKPFGIQVKAAKELAISVEIPEDGKTAQENARKKSISYAAALGKAVLSMDHALYLDGLANDQQPGIHTRRLEDYQGNASDKEILGFYSRIISRLGGQVSGRWEIALCMADPGGKFFERTIVSSRQFIANPSKRMTQGYPLESIQIDAISGKYMSEMTPEERDTFWQNKIGRELNEFVNDAVRELSLKTIEY